ncbi:uncharacterized protein EAE98_000804 [Botrytis deweyae]|uniref:Protein artemis n=1 Tax=Botrytis deweyae TaxID=2478750 RepID=A0ABQ7IZP1_9HELO|nr:uncharacterized protein EAE98_000804 [Botrytis deweyae]KAF7938466.1 hypothetical protein EAE98_000804 [Botrytis deweyae]
MSTFGGYMPEFPDIRVDHFRQIIGRTAPLACFLSHVHSDHLEGLDNDRVKLPFVYCSAATREILLRLEKRRDRLNLAQGILEKEKRTYKHLKSVLKPIPLETPTLIELAPKNEVRVTLFDANHCTGAVMFLFEKENTAVLYTGDIRSEPWFVNNLTRSPFLIEYTSGMKTLDCIYLDTSNTGPLAFPTKADGLKEMIEKVRKYPPNTKFHFSAWTFGYEEVWAALSRTLDSQIHVDKYKYKLYQSLRQDGSDGQSRFLAPEGPVLVGCIVGNGPKEGCLTTDKSVRIHSCEKGMGCSAYGEDDIVLIRPFIARGPDGVEIAEVGIGGGWGDLVPSYEVAMDFDDVKEFLETVFAETDQPIIEDIRSMLLAELISTKGAISLDGMQFGSDTISLKGLGESLLRKLAQKSTVVPDKKRDAIPEKGLPKVITFPYSRHSSYAELCHLVEIFKPKDVYPCTVDEEEWHEGLSMKTLFGEYCSASVFRHDSEIRELVAIRVAEMAMMSSQQTQTTTASKSSPMSTGHFEELALTAARLDNGIGPSTPNPFHEGTTRIGRQSMSNWSQELVSPSPAPPSQMGVTSISQTPRSVATNSDLSSSRQASQRRAAADMISPPPLKRVRLSEDSQMNDSTPSKSPTPSESVTDLEQQGVASSAEISGDNVDLTVPLKLLMEKLGNVPALFEQTRKALLELDIGEIDVEAYISQELSTLDSIHAQIDQLVPPPILSALYASIQSLSQEVVADFLGLRDHVGLYAYLEIEVGLYTRRQLTPLQHLIEEIKHIKLYLDQSPSQRKPWRSNVSLESMSEVFTLEANSDADTMDHQDISTPMDENELAAGVTTEDDEDIFPTLSEEEDLHEDENFPFYDPIDKILRCGDCGHEIWEDAAGRVDLTLGFCTGCGNGISPFYEDADFPGKIPRIYEDEYGSEADEERARALIGDTHLDYQSSAYDTQDEDSELVLNEDYEVNSFIDNSEVLESDSESETSDSESEGEVDYKSAFKKLQANFDLLMNDYCELADAFEEFRHDMLGTSEEEDDGDIEDNDEEEGVRRDELGAHVVDVLVKQGELVVEDVLVSSFRSVVEEEGEGDVGGDEFRDKELEQDEATIVEVISITSSDPRGESMEL